MGKPIRATVPPTDRRYTSPVGWIKVKYFRGAVRGARIMSNQLPDPNAVGLAFPRTELAMGLTYPKIA